jgi:uncharacterized protein
MVQSFDGYNYVMRLDKDERLSVGMQQFFAQNDVQGGWITAVGGALEVTLGFYDLDSQKYLWKTFKQLLEITSLPLDEQGRPGYHLHGTFADKAYQVVGGHVADLVVGGTCEIFVHRSYHPLHRKHDDSVGLTTLDL